MVYICISRVTGTSFYRHIKEQLPEIVDFYHENKDEKAIEAFFKDSEIL